jgi:hypothetical protein
MSSILFSFFERENISNNTFLGWFSEVLHSNHFTIFLLCSCFALRLHNLKPFGIRIVHQYL